MATDKVHSHEPLLQREFGILKDSPYKARKPFVAMTAFELVISVTTDIDMLTTTERANHLRTPSLFGDEITAAFVRVEVADKRDERIEVR